MSFKYQRDIRAFRKKNPKNSRKPVAECLRCNNAMYKATESGLCFRCNARQQVEVECPLCGELRFVRWDTFHDKKKFRGLCQSCSGKKEHRLDAQPIPAKVIEESIVKVQEARSSFVHDHLIRRKSGRCKTYFECRRGYAAPMIDIPKILECSRIAGMHWWDGFSAKNGCFEPLSPEEIKTVNYFSEQRETGFLSGGTGYELPS